MKSKKLKKNRLGQNFNDLTAEVMEILSQGKGQVQKNIKIKGPDGDREIDVLYLEKNGLGRNVRTVIECKDYGRKVDVQIVDAFVSKCKDVLADVGVLISRKGFSRTAIQKAKRENIGLQMLQDIKDLDKTSFINEIPVWVHTLSPKIHVGFSFRLEEATTITNFSRIYNNDIEKKIGEAIDRVWNNLHSTDFPATMAELGIEPPYYLVDEAGNKIYLTEDSVRLFVEESWCKGKLSQINNTKIVTDISENRQNIICYTNDINLSEFVNVDKDEVPKGVPYLEAKEIVKNFHFFNLKIVKIGDN